MKKLILLCCLFSAGCGCPQPTTPEQKQAEMNKIWTKHLPAGATDITDVGNNWVTFRWKGKKYLYQLAGTHGGHSALVELKEE